MGNTWRLDKGYVRLAMVKGLWVTPLGLGFSVQGLGLRLGFGVQTDVA